MGIIVEREKDGETWETTIESWEGIFVGNGPATAQEVQQLFRDQPALLDSIMDQAIERGVARRVHHVVPLFKCKCGVMAKRVDVVREGNVEASGFMCEACIAKANGMIDRVRPIFQAMIAAGIEREIANDAMTFLLDRIDP